MRLDADVIPLTLSICASHRSDDSSRSPDPPNDLMTTILLVLNPLPIVVVVYPSKYNTDAVIIGCLDPCAEREVAKGSMR